MLEWLDRLLHRRRLERFLEESQAWYQACLAICRACDRALHDENLSYMDIGAIVDETDWLLVRLRGDIIGPHTPARERYPALARRVRRVTSQVCHVRNLTARFLIRSQGPLPALFESRPEERRVYYQRALQEVGLAARLAQREVYEEVKAVWREMQGVRIEAERLVRAY